jgi:glyoxylase-like metal-dependent hydrolase (beta-lactamase superfamily II)
MLTFLTEPEPVREAAEDIAPGIRRMVADNPSKMTYHGTNTYLIETDEGTLVVDPGPDLAAHVAALRWQAGKIAGILATHSHRDHIDAIPALREGLDVPVLAFGGRILPEIRLDGLAEIFGWRLLHTPGHIGDHVCLIRDADGVILTGDHVMGWNSSVVIPPDGDMADYMESLDRLIAEPASVYLPGHGPPIPNPHKYAADLLAHRKSREAEVMACLADGIGEVPAMVARIYPDLAPPLVPVAARNVTAHLLKLARDGLAVSVGDTWWGA